MHASKNYFFYLLNFLFSFAYRHGVFLQESFIDDSLYFRNLFGKIPVALRGTSRVIREAKCPLKPMEKSPFGQVLFVLTTMIHSIFNKGTR